MTKKEKAKCNLIIHMYSAIAGTIGAGLAQLPCSDSLVIIPVQTAMVVQLGSVFGKKMTESSAKAAVGTGLATMGGRAVSQIAIGWFPGYGNVVNATTATTITESLGWIVAKRYSEGRDF